MKNFFSHHSLLIILKQIESLKLQRNPAHYHYLNSTSLTECLLSDKENFEITRNAMTTVGFNINDIMSVFQVSLIHILLDNSIWASFHQLVAVVLKLGNLKLQHHTKIDGNEGCIILKEEGICQTFYYFQMFPFYDSIWTNFRTARKCWIAQMFMW